MRGVVIGALLAALIAACASGQVAQTAPRSMDPRKDEIRDLWMQIRDWRVDERWSADPVIPTGKAFPAIPQMRKCTVEREPATEVCQDTCSLKDAICDNAERICDIADELGDDSWAHGKCKSAKASCREATEKCCECTAAEKTPASTDKQIF
jgi:hypothetical protein